MGEPPLVTVARGVWSGVLTPEDFHAAFARCVVWSERPGRPGVLVADVAGRGRWTSVFSSLDRLAAHTGECDYLSAMGADLLSLVPEGVGIMVDPDDEHRFPVLTRMASPDAVAQVWTRWARERVTTGAGNVEYGDLPPRAR